MLEPSEVGSLPLLAFITCTHIKRRLRYSNSMFSTPASTKAYITEEDLSLYRKSCLECFITFFWNKV